MYLPLGNNFLSAFFGIFLFNLIVGCGFIVATNFISAKSISLGYVYPLVQASLFGIFLGTDSFAISHGGRLFPSLMLVHWRRLLRDYCIRSCCRSHRKAYAVEPDRMAWWQLTKNQENKRLSLHGPNFLF